METCPEEEQPQPDCHIWPSSGFQSQGCYEQTSLWGKRSEKELCDNTQFSPSENLDHWDRVLPHLNEYYKQATPPKTATRAKSQENSLNKNKEFLQNGCKLFHLKYDPVDNAQMHPVWTQFIASGRSKLVLGLRLKAFVLPNPGQQDPTQDNADLAIYEVSLLLHWKYLYSFSPYGDESQEGSRGQHGGWLLPSMQVYHCPTKITGSMHY